MKISIIGTNGFLSTEIGKYCNRHNIEVVSYGLSEPLAHEITEFVKVNLLDSKINVSKLAQSDIIIYASGAGIQSNLKESYELIYRLNTYVPIEISCQLAEVGFEGTLVTFGSYFEIGNNEENILFDETAVSTSLLAMPNHYCLSKRILTRYVSSTFAKFNHLHIILPTIYGHGEASHRIIPYTVNAIKNNIPLQFTNGYQIRQYLFAGDIPQMLLDLVQRREKGIINIPGKETYSIRQLIAIIFDYFNKTVNQDLFGKAIREDVGMQNLQLDGSLIDQILPHAHYTSLKEALKLYDRQ